METMRSLLLIIMIIGLLFLGEHLANRYHSTPFQQALAFLRFGCFVPFAVSTILTARKEIPLLLLFILISLLLCFAHSEPYKAENNITSLLIALAAGMLSGRISQFMNQERRNPNDS